MRVSWNAVTNASGYLVQYSSDSAFVNDTHAIMLDGTSTTLSGLKADTMYHIHVKALAFEGDTDSSFSLPYLTRTGLASGDETATHIQDWLDEMQSVFQNFATLMPELETTVLTLAERRRLQGSGVRRYGFIDKVSDVAEQYPQFWPAVVYGEDSPVDFQVGLKENLRKIEALRNLLLWVRTLERVIGDLFLLTSNVAFQQANTYYGAVRVAARSNVLGARQIYQLLQLFWRRTRDKSQEQPTIPETIRDVRGILRGTKVGSVYVSNEADSTVKGKRTIVDETRKKPKSGVKVVEHASTELSADCADVC
jgi:hypothetical protein